MYKIAFISGHSGDWTYSTYTIIDGLIQLHKEDSNIEFYISTDLNVRHPISVSDYVLPTEDFIKFANKADFIVLDWCQYRTDTDLLTKIGGWGKTVYMDGSELGGNKRYDFTVQRDILLGEYTGGYGGIDEGLFRSCPVYLRREKPYSKGVVPFPYGITEKYVSQYKEGKEKDIDFCCVWGQDDYPLMRRHITELLVKYCKENGFTYWIDKTKNREEFYKVLARSKVGISVGGGGYDTARFWEVLANNCILLTEKIDVYPLNSEVLDYTRIYEFTNLYDFQEQLEKVCNYLKNNYSEDSLKEEYRDILERHSSKSRAQAMIKKASESIHKPKSTSSLDRLKISFVEPHLKQFGGIRRVIELSNLLTERGHDVTIFHSDGSKCDWLHGIAKTKPAEDVLKEYHDVLVFNDPNLKDYKLAMKAKAGLKVFYILGLYNKELLVGPFLKIYMTRQRRMRILKRILTSTDFLFIANATWEKIWIEKNLGINVELALGGVNLDMFYPVDVKKDRTKIKILRSGDVRMGKGTNDITEAIKIAQKKEPSIVVETYAGKGISQDKMSEVYSGADIFIEASTHGGWNNPVAEAMCCKTPVICTDIGAVRDFAFNEETALVVPIGDIEAMAEAILRIIYDNELRERIIENAYKTILQFSWSITADKLESIIAKK